MVLALGNCSNWLVKYFILCHVCGAFRLCFITSLIMVYQSKKVCYKNKLIIKPEKKSTSRPVRPFGIHREQVVGNGYINVVLSCHPRHQKQTMAEWYGLTSVARGPKSNACLRLMSPQTGEKKLFGKWSFLAF